MNTEKIINALDWRYATKEFDSSKKVSEKDIQTILEAGRLSPSSFGIEAWKFIVVKNEDIRKQLQEAGYDQSKITDASHLIVIARRTDAENLSSELMTRLAQAQSKSVEDFTNYKDMIDQTIQARKESGSLDGWIASQTYIALGIMMQTAALLEIDTGPMEGFDYEKVNQILDLKSQNLSVVTMLAVGYRGDDPSATGPKVRRSSEEVVKTIE